VRLVSWRGLWDRFAEPWTPEAYRRSLAKRVPCFIDARAAGAAPAALVAATLLSRTDTCVYVAVDSSAEMHTLAAQAQGLAPLRFVDRGSGSPCAILEARGGRFERVGSYHPFPSLPSLSARAGELALVEAGDVLLTAIDRRQHARRLREEESPAFAQALGGAVFLVSDLVEHRQLLAAQGVAR
jgi:hypothetical protein